MINWFCRIFRRRYAKADKRFTSGTRDQQKAIAHVGRHHATMPAGVVGVGHKQRPIRRRATKHMLEPDRRSSRSFSKVVFSRQSVCTSIDGTDSLKQHGYQDDDDDNHIFYSTAAVGIRLDEFENDNDLAKSDR
jgi:hypothetical protein